MTRLANSERIGILLLVAPKRLVFVDLLLEELVLVLEIVVLLLLQVITQGGVLGVLLSGDEEVGVAGPPRVAARPS